VEGERGERFPLPSYSEPAVPVKAGAGETHLSLLRKTSLLPSVLQQPDCGEHFNMAGLALGTDAFSEPLTQLSLFIFPIPVTQLGNHAELKTQERYFTADLN